MAVLVTRRIRMTRRPPAPCVPGVLRCLQARMLQFAAVAFQDDADARYDGVMVASANALRAIKPQLKDSRLLDLPLLRSAKHPRQRRAAPDSVR